MAKRTVQKSARPSSAHPDAAIFALAEKMAEALVRSNQSADAFAAAEQRAFGIEPPKALARTEGDAAMGFFAGKPGGTYEREEIDNLRALCRRLGRSCDCPEFPKVYDRCKEIIEAWADWRQRKDAQEARAGLHQADLANGAALDDCSYIGRQLAMRPISTVDGLMAKARALKDAFGARVEIEKEIDRELSKFGVYDSGTVALVIAHDVLALADRGKETVSAPGQSR